MDGAEQTGRQRDATTITRITRSLNERVIFRKSECGQRAGIWAMMPGA